VLLAFISVKEESNHFNCLSSLGCGVTEMGAAAMELGEVVFSQEKGMI
jgi:hypothetical protein